MNRDPTTSDPLRMFMDDTRTPMDFTHDQLVRALCLACPDIQTRGFPKAIRSLMPADEDPSEYPIVDFIPDGYSIWMEEREIHLFEVEITSRLSREKRHSLGRFADDMEGYGWALGIHTIDRYGTIAELPWIPMYLSWATEEAEKATPEDIVAVRALFGKVAQ